MSEGASSPFRSFWIGGYEGADHINGAGQAHDMRSATEHDQRLDEDYRRAARLGIRTVRESIGWRLSESGGGDIDLSRAVRMARLAERHGMQILWTLMHYGVPPDLSLRDDAMIGRLARFAGEVARVLGPLSVQPPVYTPVNEISFLAWAAAESPIMGPAGRLGGGPGASSMNSGYEIKRRLVRASLAAIAAIRAVDPRARFLHIDPAVHVVAPVDRPELAPQAAQVESFQWQAHDLLCGRLEPELGGNPGALDWIGINHYHNSQWETATEQRLPWHLRDPRRHGMAQLLQMTWERYRRPMIVGETSHIGVGRAAWLHEVAGEVQRARSRGLPVHGICLYPLLDRPDWDDPRRWHRSGLWHLPAGPDGAAERRTRHAYQPYVQALNNWRSLPAPVRVDDRPGLLVVLPARWEIATERLQPLLTRLASSFEVLVMEPRKAYEPRLRRYTLAPHLELLTLYGAAAPLLREFMQGAARTRWVGWSVGAAAQTLLRELPVDRRVHEPESPDEDATDADLVLTVGPVQHRHWTARHPAVRHLPNGVDPRPWRRIAGSYEDEELNRLLDPVPAPRLGFIGPIDNRLDLPLIAALARQRPQLHLLMIGPLIGLTPIELPQAVNLHWLGEHHPDLLPGLLQGCAAAVLPYRVDDPSTAHLNPGLVPLCEAAGIPVVATPLPELQPPAPSVRLAADADSFIRACDEALAAPASSARAQRRVRAELGWDRIADRARRLLLEALGERADADQSPRHHQPNTPPGERPSNEHD